MHNRIIALIAFVCLALVACKKDELTPIEERLTAEWFVHTEILDRYMDDELVSSDTIEYVEDILPEDIYGLDENEEVYCLPRYFRIDLREMQLYISPMHADTGIWHVDAGKFLVLNSTTDGIPYDKDHLYEVKNLRSNNLLLQSFENTGGTGYNRFSRRLECTKEDPSCILPPPADAEIE